MFMYNYLFALCVQTDKVFSFLSQDEVEKLKQEEEKKIETLKRDKKNKKLLRATDGNNLVEGDDNVDGTSSDSDSDSDSDNSDDDDDDDDDDEEGEEEEEEEEADDDGKKNVVGDSKARR